MSGNTYPMETGGSISISDITMDLDEHVGNVAIYTSTDPPLVS